MSGILAESERLLALFQRAGAMRIAPDILQPADVLLDLYGEDIRARAYVTADPIRGEQMLRPDFTVPVVQHHMEVSAEPARYTYSGPVFRRQDGTAGRPSEYEQVGYEVFDRSNPAQVEAEMFALFYDEIAPLGLRAYLGDVGLLMAAVDGLNTSAPRKAALRRHIWRPERFRQMLHRFAEERPMPVLAAGGPQIGLRSAAEIENRIAAMEEDAKTPPITKAEVAAIDNLLAIKGTVPDALGKINALVNDFTALQTAAAQLEVRMQAIADFGVRLDDLSFEAAYGLTVMEYYDGFVFGFYAQDCPDWPAVASGGRYDMLTHLLGGGAHGVPAVGGILRPDYTEQLRGAGA